MHADRQGLPAPACGEALTDGGLDHAVAQAEGHDVRPWPEMGEGYWRLYLDDDVPVAYLGTFRMANMRKLRGLEHYCPSVSPVLAAEIIDRERISTVFDPATQAWVALPLVLAGETAPRYTGATPRQAAMRCHVATTARRQALVPA
jgi:hypothetical protein